MVTLNYNGKEVNLANTLEKGEKELDILINDVNIDDTIEISTEYLENTIKLDTIEMDNENE